MDVFTYPKPQAPVTPERTLIAEYYRADETKCLEILLKVATLPPAMVKQIQATAEKLVVSVRQQRIGKGGLDAFLYEYDLSSEEGIALMCLAESMLRVNDIPTLDRLIHDKITTADWDSHRGKSDSSFVNAASWALMLTGKILTPDEDKGNYFTDTLRRFIKRSSEPVIRKTMGEAIRILGKQFVMGRTIEEALERSRSSEKIGYTFSYDMLGEAARTAADADRYLLAYQNAITAIGKAARSKSIYANPGISIKLSALYPRYEFSQQERAVPILIERLRGLALQAKAANINLTVDAEEADRLELSLDIIEAIVSDSTLKNWNGFGLALQAYQKRAFYVIDWLADLAKRNQTQIMLRLVKGAYWDTEIKDTQVRGLSNYPVFTRKASTDVSFLACAKKILEYGDVFYPQFATHNAYTVAAILAMVGKRRDFEFQCLKGMGRALYDEMIGKDKMDIACRIYAPVGQHEDLLPYLVRRLLENGANSSFVNRIVDEKTPIKALIENPVTQINSLITKPHPKIKLPAHIYPDRLNSTGLDLTDRIILARLTSEMDKALTQVWTAIPTVKTLDGVASIPATKPVMLDDPNLGGADAEMGACSIKQSSSAHCPLTYSVTDPSDRNHQIGSVIFCTPEDMQRSIEIATHAAPLWDLTPVTERAACLERLADLLEMHQPELMAMLCREAGKCMPDALGEVREAVDFCRYYAKIARHELTPKILPGPTGEFNQLEMHGRGVFFCISPWNFPLAIFTGQVVAALVAGNCVLAKPAEQTSLIGAKAVALMHQAGIPKEVVQLTPGKGSMIGPIATADNRVSGVMFTGSTETGRGINKTLAERIGPIVPFIAETGGQNAMIADSTALPEQLVNDVLVSAFNSAGQRCSALRVLFLQSEIADRVIVLIKGAMQELKVGDPAKLSTDIGPIIGEDAKKTLQAHVERMNKEAKLIAEVSLPPEAQYGTFFAPRAYEIPSLDILDREVFGPILHIVRYESSDLDKILKAINDSGYGLTLGIHTRIKATEDYILERVHVGNRYVNRNMIGAVVGVQPFGGEGLSGTGPKAGGPHYLTRLCHERSLAINTTAAGGNASLMSLEE